MGPLTGLRIIEIEGIGPCPFGGMLLADLGAEVGETAVNHGELHLRRLDRVPSNRRVEEFLAP